MKFNWDYFVSIGPDMLRAAVTTVQVTILAMLFAGVFGLVIALARISSVRPFRWLAIGYVEVLRSVPVLILIYYVFFVLPLFGITFDPLSVGVVALGTYYAAYMSEVYRAGFRSVPRGQWEVAVALNMSPYRTMRSVVLPQAIPAVIPGIGNYLIEMFKATPLLAAIGLHELLGEGQQLAANTFRYPEVYLWIGAIFLAMSYPASLGVRWLEKRTLVGGRGRSHAAGGPVT